MREPRKFKKGATYHVTSKINRSEMDLREPRIKEMLLTFLKRTMQKYPFQLFNFCIMDNHIHLLIKPARGQSLSQIMQWFKGNFAKYWNKVHNKKGGHLWGERFFSEIISTRKQFLRIFKYIDKNPKRAGMVARAEDWEFGGLYHYQHGRSDLVNILWRAILEVFFLHKSAEWSG
ncbi:MAG: transposase [Treponema sp.]|jgi:REP element-mobilizing transposase RayT|nr:transposase [Treponema sp.]